MIPFIGALTVEQITAWEQYLDFWQDYHKEVKTNKRVRCAKCKRFMSRDDMYLVDSKMNEYHMTEACMTDIIEERLNAEPEKHRWIRK
jgi:hypothetical protein